MIRLEICVDTVEGLNAAIEGGADRIELCSALSVGGLSPSLALLEAARTCPVPVYVMVRPRAGDFEYSQTELSAMEREIAQVRDLGLAGVVLGAGSEQGLDIPALDRLTAAAGSLGKTLHRVVDLIGDRMGILEPARDMGFERILTSGGRTRAADGTREIRQMIEAAPPGLSIMPGSGVTAENVSGILSQTGAQEIHASAAMPQRSHSSRLVELGFAPGTRKTITAESVRRLKQACVTG